MPPGSRHGSPWWLWVITLGLLGTVVYMQRPEPTDPNTAVQAAAGMEKITPPKVDALAIMGKLLFAVRTLPPMSAPQIQQYVDQSVGWESTNPLLPPSAANPPKERPKPFPAADRLRATILAGETLGPAELDWRLRDVEKTLDPASPLVSDVATVRTLYGVPREVADSEVRETKPVALTTEMRDAVPAADMTGFRERHGWFADLATTRGDDQAPVRQKAAHDGTVMVALLVVIGGVVCLAGVAGLVLLIMAAVMYFGGTLRPAFLLPRPETEWPAGESMVFPTPGAAVRASSVWLETVAVFLGGFLALKLVGEAVHAAFPKQGWAVWVTLLGQWVLVSAIFWPVVRGMSFDRWQKEIGWHKGRGVFTEIGCGIMGYLACLPVYFGMALVVVLISMLISLLTGSDPVSPADNKLLDVVEGGGVFAMVCIYLLATVWAPIVEESIFRGAMFRHLRRRLPLVLAALGSCMVFAVLHGYIIAGLFMVGTLGFWFALMREWRGSLIAPATAHAIHNGVVLATLITIVQLGSV